MLKFLITLLLFLGIWHFVFIYIVSNKLSNGSIDNTYQFIPGYEFLTSIQSIISGYVNQVDPFSNQIIITKLGSRLCISRTAPIDIAYIDPYNLIKPLTIKICL